MAVFEYPTICYKQRSSARNWFCLFSAPAGQVLQWARVDRLEPDNVRGVQRRRNDSKTRSIRHFLEADPENTIPTTLTIALLESAASLQPPVDPALPNVGAIRSIRIDTRDGEDLPGLIIDGQHRIFGINEFDPATHVSIVLLLGPDDAEIAFQFLVINNKVSKVSPDHMRALRLAYAEDDLDARLTKSARMKSTGAPTYLETIDTEDDSPFKGRIKWPRNPESEAYNLIPPSAFETALLNISSQQLAPTGDLENKNYDFVVDLFLQIWRKIRSVWPDAWTDGRSRLLSKLGVVCMSQYIVDSLIARVEASEDIELVRDLSQVSQLVEAILARQEYGFWTLPWTATSLDTSAGRDIVMKDLKKIAINKWSNSPWNTSLRLVEILD